MIKIKLNLIKFKVELNLIKYSKGRHCSSDMNRTGTSYATELIAILTII